MKLLPFVQYLEFLAELMAFTVIVGMQDGQRRIVGVTDAAPVQLAVRGNRFQCNRITEVVFHVQRSTPVGQQAQQGVGAVIGIRSLELG